MPSAYTPAMLSSGGGAAATLDTLLRSIGTPHLYLRNAFRISGLSVDASPGDLRRRVQQVRAVLALGGAPVPGGPLAPSPAPDLEAVQQALARLRDPLARLVDEFFWFWPDAGLDALVAGRVEEAENLWQESSAHNLAVLNHALALDEELAQPQRKLIGAPRRWREAYRCWLAVWRDDACWARFDERVRRSGHPGLGWVAPALRERLPLVLSSVNAVIAADGLERGRDDDSTRVHWRMAAHQDLPPRIRARALRAATDPIISRVHTHGDRALAVTRNDAASAPAAAGRLHEQTAPLLRMMTLSAAPDSDNVHDAVARTLLKLAFEYHRATNDWVETLRILRLAQDAGRGRAMLQSVRENVQGVEYMLAREGDLEEQRRRREQRERDDEVRRRRAEERRAEEAYREKIRREAIEAYERRRTEREGS